MQLYIIPSPDWSGLTTLTLRPDGVPSYELVTFDDGAYAGVTISVAVSGSNQVDDPSVSGDVVAQVLTMFGLAASGG